MGLLFDVYVLSRLRSCVCSLGSKGQFVDLFSDEQIYHEEFMNYNNQIGAYILNKRIVQFP